jgi:hypothetical protein
MQNSGAPRPTYGWWRIVGIVGSAGLGLAAVCLVVFSTTQKQTQIGVLLGLWGGLIGMFVVFGSRRVQQEAQLQAAQLREAQEHAAQLHNAQLQVAQLQEAHLAATKESQSTQEVELRRFGELQLARETAARREADFRLEIALRGEIERVLTEQIGSLREEVASLRAEVVDKLGGQLRMERIETTRVIGSDLEALQTEIRRLRALQDGSPLVASINMPSGRPVRAADHDIVDAEVVERPTEHPARPVAEPSGDATGAEPAWGPPAWAGWDDMDPGTQSNAPHEPAGAEQRHIGMTDSGWAPVTYGQAQDLLSNEAAGDRPKPDAYGDLAAGAAADRTPESTATQQHRSALTGPLPSDLPPPPPAPWVYQPPASAPPLAPPVPIVAEPPAPAAPMSEVPRDAGPVAPAPASPAAGSSQPTAPASEPFSVSRDPFAGLPRLTPMPADFADLITPIEASETKPGPEPESAAAEPEPQTTDASLGMKSGKRRAPEPKPEPDVDEPRYVGRRRAAAEAAEQALRAEQAEKAERAEKAARKAEKAERTERPANAEPGEQGGGRRRAPDDAPDDLMARLHTP